MKKIEPIEITRESCDRTHPDFTLQFIRVTQGDWSTRVVKGVRFRRSCDEKLKIALREQVRAARKIIVSFQRHPNLVVIKDLTWLDYRYGQCNKCGLPIQIPGCDRFLCSRCGYVTRNISGERRF